MDDKKTWAIAVVLICLASLVLLPHATGNAQTKTLIVPDQYPTIQDAVDNARAGDTVYVKAGTYNVTTQFFDSQLLINKSISVIGEDSKNTVILTTENYNVVRGWSFGVEISGNASISGFTIVGDVNVMLVLGDAKVTNNFIDLTGGAGDNAIEAEGSTTIDSNAINSINGPCASSSQQGTCGFTDQPDDNTTFHNNVITGFGVGVSAWSSNLKVFNNTFTGDAMVLFISQNPSLLAENNIENSTEYSLQATTAVNATYNWWGTTDAQAINKTIDRSQFAVWEPNMSYYMTQNNVSFTPFLSSPNLQAKPTQTLPPQSLPELSALTIISLMVTIFAVVAVLRYQRQTKKFD